MSSWLAGSLWHTHTHTHTHTDMCVCVCVCVCVGVCYITIVCSACISNSSGICECMCVCVCVCAWMLVCVSINNEFWPLACLMARSMLMARSSTTNALTLKASKQSREGCLVACGGPLFLLSVTSHTGTSFTSILLHLCLIVTSSDPIICIWTHQTAC